MEMRKLSSNSNADITLMLTTLNPVQKLWDEKVHKEYTKYKKINNKPQRNTISIKRMPIPGLCSIESDDALSHW